MERIQVVCYPMHCSIGQEAILLLAYSNAWNERNLAASIYKINMHKHGGYTIDIQISPSYVCSREIEVCIEYIHM